MKFSSAIQYKLAYLKLTRAGKIRLTPFTDKTIYCANKQFEADYNELPENAYNTLYGLCIFFTDKLKQKPNWDNMSQVPFDEKGCVTENGELFDPTIVREIRKQYKEKQKEWQKKARTGTYQRSPQGPTFTKGLTYWKHGKEYKYPDQAIDPDDFNDNIGPCLNNPKYESDEKWTQNDPRRKTINPVAELQKALKTGKVDEPGLREMFIKWKNLCHPVYEFISYFLNQRDSGQSIEEIINGYETYKQNNTNSTA